MREAIRLKMKNAFIKTMYQKMLLDQQAENANGFKALAQLVSIRGYSPREHGDPSGNADNSSSSLDFGSQHNPAAASFELVLEDSPPIDEGPKSDKENDHVEDEIPTDENAQISAGLSGSEDIEEVSRKEDSDELDADEHVKSTTGTASEGGAARVEDEAEVNELLVSSDEELWRSRLGFGI